MHTHFFPTPALYLQASGGKQSEQLRDMLSEFNAEVRFLQVRSIVLEEKTVQDSYQVLNVQMQKAAQTAFVSCQYGASL